MAYDDIIRIENESDIYIYTHFIQKFYKALVYNFFKLFTK